VTGLRVGRCREDSSISASFHAMGRDKWAATRCSGCRRRIQAGKCGDHAMKAVRFHEYGGIDVLRVEEVARPLPDPGQVLVEVRAAGIQPGEVHIRTGELHERWPATFPSGAAGGVGSLAVQLARRRSVTVIGLASELNHAWLTARGIVPVEYGHGMAERIRQASGGNVDAFIDTFGEGYVKLAVELGVRPERIRGSTSGAAPRGRPACPHRRTRTPDRVREQPVSAVPLIMPVLWY
jgi:hypothetical protein